MRSSGAIPHPVSVILILRIIPFKEVSLITSKKTLPLSVNLIELFNKLSITCFNLLASISIISGTFGLITKLKSKLFSYSLEANISFADSIHYVDYDIL